MCVRVREGERERYMEIAAERARGKEDITIMIKTFFKLQKIYLASTSFSGQTRVELSLLPQKQAPSPPLIFALPDFSRAQCYKTFYDRYLQMLGCLFLAALSSLARSLE